MALVRVVQDRAVARYQRQVKCSGRCYEYTVCGIAMQAARQKPRIDQYRGAHLRDAELGVSHQPLKPSEGLERRAHSTESGEQGTFPGRDRRDEYWQAGAVSGIHGIDGCIVQLLVLGNPNRSTGVE
jgi:hypothetical protein